MTITKEALEQRLAQLQKGRDEILVELHATSGAIQEVEFWLATLETLEKKDEEVKDGSNKPNNNIASS